MKGPSAYTLFLEDNNSKNNQRMKKLWEITPLIIQDKYFKKSDEYAKQHGLEPFYENPEDILSTKIVEKIFKKYPHFSAELRSFFEGENLSEDSLIYPDSLKEFEIQTSIANLKKTAKKLIKSIENAKNISVENDKMMTLNSRIYLKELFKAYGLI